MAEPASQAEPRVTLQLRMVWPPRLLNALPEIRIHPDYELRTFHPSDEHRWFQIMKLAGFTGWDDERLALTRQAILPGGWFLAVHRSSGVIAATAMATGNPLEFQPIGGELSWVAGHPEHAGKGLGRSVCAAVTAHFLNAGYKNIFLRTDDWRLPAIKTYLKLGYQPLLFAPDMADRWEAICAKLPWPFTPASWPKPD